MSYERFIGMRYLMAKRRKSVLSVITLISVGGVALGVTALIVVLSVMGGFKKDLKEKIIGTKAHIVIKGIDDAPIADVDTAIEVVTNNNRVIGASPYVEGEVMVSSPTNLSGVVLRGINPARIGSVSNLPENVVEGKLIYLEQPELLLAEVEKGRSKELNELFERVRNEKKELEIEKKKSPAAANKADDGDFGDEGFMEPLPGGDEEDSAEGGEFGDDGFMPGIFDDDEGSDSAGDSDAMPGFEEEEEADSQVPGLIVGKELAKSLQVDPGDEVNVVTPNGEMGPMGPIPRSRPFRVVGVFYSGMYEFDANYAYTTVESAQSFINIDGVSGIELKTTNVEEAPSIAAELVPNLDPSLDVLDWEELNRSLFYALKLEKIAMFVILTFIILVASFSIVAMLIMIVIEKGREIAILKALGATNAGVMRTFIFQGTVIGVVGTFAGLVFGLSICYFLSEFGFPLNSEVYYISTLPVAVDPVEIATVVAAAMLISLLATIYPSVQAARLNPVDGLRDD